LEHASPAVLVLFFVFCGLVLWQIQRARSGKRVFLRKIAGLDVVEEAVGRATEMGRPIMFNPGLDGICVQLFCALACLKYVVEVAARVDMPVLVPVHQPVTYPLAQEFWKQAYAEAGKPNLFRVEECIRYLSPDQAAFGAATAAWIHRDRPGAIFLFGYYGYEALFIAESGQKAGAIQLAATHAYYQVPFFIVSCDYTVIGEEFFAAGAYFSRDPVQIGSLVGQDISKIIILALIVLGSILAIVLNHANPLALLLQYQ